MEDVKIRPIRRADNAPLAALIRRIFEDLGVPKTGTAYEDGNLDSLYEYYQQERAAYYVVTRAGMVLGGAGIAALRGGTPAVCELQKMYFGEALRGRGMGRVLLKTCLDTAWLMGYTHCYLETMPYMEAAQSLYRKFGFEYLPAPMGNTGHSSCHVWMKLALGKTNDPK